MVNVGEIKSCIFVRLWSSYSMDTTTSILKTKTNKNNKTINQSINQSSNNMKIKLNPIKNYDSLVPIINTLSFPSVHLFLHFVIPLIYINCK